jgi:NodT family efflux transporter outer membrane factor (OMF) lipoprotein
MRRLFVHSVVFMLIISMSGCSGMKYWWNNNRIVGPNYGRPIVPVADDWIESTDESFIVQQGGVDDWWRVFNDPVLEHLVAAAYQQNLSLRAAGLRVLEARTQRQIAAANLFPQSQALFGSYARNQLSRATATASPLAPRAFSDWQLGFDLSWEIDLWGRIRRSVEAADAGIDAEIENYDNVLCTLIGDVATTYIQLRSFDERIRLAKANVEKQTGSLKITEIKLREGDISELDVQQAKANVADTSTLIPSLELQRRQAVNLLALLLGMTPYDLEPLLAATGKIPDAPQEVVVGIPAELLRRRPDVRLAERQIAAQSAQIGIAEAELLPQFALGGEIKLNSETFGGLFDGSSVAGAFAPGFRWNILNYGRLVKNIRVQELRFQQAIIAYENAVLSAHREVEDAMVQFLKAKEQAAGLQRSVAATERSVELVQIEYKEGEVDFGRVFVLEANLVSAQDRLIAAEADVALALTRVYKSLGGGWQIRNEQCYEGAYPVELIELETLPVVNVVEDATVLEESPGLASDPTELRAAPVRSAEDLDRDEPRQEHTKHSEVPIIKKTTTADTQFLPLVRPAKNTYLQSEDNET